jgi:quercetin dioxygenase-like cupin family protein
VSFTSCAMCIIVVPTMHWTYGCRSPRVGPCATPTASNTFARWKGRPTQLGPLKLAFKRTDGEGEGSYSIFESLERPGASVALHRHPTFQETFIVLEGRFDFDVAGERRSLGHGEMLVIPRGAPHGFACTSPEPGRMLTRPAPRPVSSRRSWPTSAWRTPRARRPTPAPSSRATASSCSDQQATICVAGTPQRAMSSGSLVSTIASRSRAMTAM